MTPTFRRMAAVLTSTVAMTMLSGALPLIAQETGKGQAQSSAKKAGKRAMDPTRRVPNYFGQLALTDAQRESIYKIQARHQPKIDALEKQLDELRARRSRNAKACSPPRRKRCCRSGGPRRPRRGRSGAVPAPATRPNQKADSASRFRHVTATRPRAMAWTRRRARRRS